jgi:SPP1 gp7 family putative phage head morphogenesis protein
VRLEALDLSGYDNLIDKIAQDLHNGTIKPSDLNADLIAKTYADLSEGAAAGVGKKWETQYKKEGEDTLVTALKKNLYTFASAKTFAQLETLNKMLYYQDGKLRPFNEYSQLVKKVNAQYNKNWLQAEHQTAKTAGQMAVKWQRIQRDKDLFPNLKYRTVGDERVRDEHAALNGTIKPVDDPFWSTHFPPNGWRCRCNVVQTAEDATTDKITTQPNPVFEGNVATDEVIFSKKHQFFQLLNTDALAKKNAELMKLNAPKETLYKNGKHSVTASIYHDKKDFADNFESAKIIVDNLKVNVEIRADIKVEGYKNPEYLINGKFGDRKEVTSLRAVMSAIDSLKKQGATIIVYDFKNLTTWTTKEVTAKIKGKLNSYDKPWIDKVIIINNNVAVSFTQKELFTDFKKVYELIEKTKSL